MVVKQQGVQKGSGLKRSLDVNKRNNINALVAKEDISISDIEKIQLEGGVYVEQ